MVDYTLRHHQRARRINITVRRDGSVWVTKPKRASMREVDAFILKCQRWIVRTQQALSRRPRTGRIEPSKTQYDRYKQAAREDVSQRIDHFNALYRCSYSKIAIRNQRGRWGSCSHGRVLSFNYRLLFLPPHLADYIVVHELCHLREMNHSKRFWQLVSLAIPDHAERRKELRQIERGLLSDS